MYLHLQPLLHREVSVGDLLSAALMSAEEVSRMLPSSDPVLQQLQRVRQAGPLFLDISGADMHFTKEDIEKIVRAVRNHWHQHGFCIARSSDPHRWVQAVSDYQQPLLHWRSLSIIHGWDLIGLQLRATELSVFRLLVSHGATTVEQVATNPSIFSQQPDFGSPSVQMDIAMGRVPRGPIERNRSEARNILMRMRNRRIVVERGGFYGIVRPTRENGV
jgi:hypothetical protein